MIDGTYSMEVDVPFGRKKCTVVLRTEGDTVYADIDAPIIGKKHMEGKAEGDTFTAQGTRSIMFVGKVDYSLKGEVVGDNLHIEIQSNQGELKLDGVRV